MSRRCWSNSPRPKRPILNFTRDWTPAMRSVWPVSWTNRSSRRRKRCTRASNHSGSSPPVIWSPTGTGISNAKRTWRSSPTSTERSFWSFSAHVWKNEWACRNKRSMMERETRPCWLSYLSWARRCHLFSLRGEFLERTNADTVHFHRAMTMTARECELSTSAWHGSVISSFGHWHPLIRALLKWDVHRRSPFARLNDDRCQLRILMAEPIRQSN